MVVNASLFNYVRLFLLVGAVCGVLVAAPHYGGSVYIYIAFSAVANALLLNALRPNAIFFDIFIGIFFWIGFWLKLTIRAIFFEGKFSEAVGEFNYSGDSYDRALLVSMCGLFGLLVASFIRERFVFAYSRQKELPVDYLMSDFYQRYRNIVLASFLLMFVLIAVSNLVFGIYQKGSITQTILPYGLNGVFKWLILFGLASFSAMILKFELVAKKDISMLVIILVLLESFSTNTSLLSRGMVLNIGALAYGVYVACKLELIYLNIRKLVVSFFLFCIMFLGSAVVVNDIRGNGPGYFRDGVSGGEATGQGAVTEHVTPLFLNRWVGIEGAMAVSSSSKIGWSLFEEALREKYSENAMGYYDANLIDSPYKNTDFSKHHHLSLPGILAFFFYPGSYLFLFVCMFLLGIFAGCIELFVYKFGGRNLILCALMSEVVAYRYASFGYVPAQSYLLFGTIFLNVIMILFVYRAVEWFGSRPLRG
jgi:hypothetical protein